VLAVSLLFGVFLGTVNPPITTSAVSGMPPSMAGVAGSLASAGRQTGTTLGVALAGTLAGTGETAAVWWLVAALGAGVLALALVTTGPRATATATRAAALFAEVEGVSLRRPTG
jgi:predicted MFS family arabinose efflux permease